MNDDRGQEELIRLKKEELATYSGNLVRRGLDHLLKSSVRMSVAGVPLPTETSSIKTSSKPKVDMMPMLRKALFESLREEMFGKPQPEQTGLTAMSFTTANVGASGNVINQRQEQCWGFTEDVGDGVKLEMVEIPAGTLMMGSPKNEAGRRDSEEPQHQVTVPAFAMGKYEITQAQYQAVMGNNPSNFKGDDLPVEQVSWHDAVEFCKRLSAKTGRQYRLPSEAEWEYAARAGTTTPFAFGETITPQIVNYAGNYPYGNVPKGMSREKTTPVGSLGVANAFGLFDLHGNVYEWCEDEWHKNYNGAPTDGRAWTSSTNRGGQVLRGGSWNNYGRDCRAAARFSNASGDRYSNFGFRVAMSVMNRP